MGSEPESGPTGTPKLSLFSLPSQPPEPTGMLTPPLRPPASIPFNWEEAPGKPRTYASDAARAASSAARCLELPPRLASEVKMTSMPSPTTVLDGPYVGRSASYSAAFSRDQRRKHTNSKSFGSPPGRGYFGSLGRRGLKGNTDVVEDSSVIFPWSTVTDSGGGGAAAAAAAKVKITRFRRSGSYFSLSNTRTHLWGSLLGSLKQVVQWRSRKSKKDGFAV